MEFMTKVKIGFFAVLITIVIIVFFRNWQLVEVDVLFATIQMRSAILMIATLLVGVQEECR